MSIPAHFFLLVYTWNVGWNGQRKGSVPSRVIIQVLVPTRFRIVRTIIDTELQYLAQWKPMNKLNFGCIFLTLSTWVSYSFGLGSIITGLYGGNTTYGCTRLSALLCNLLENRSENQRGFQLGIGISFNIPVPRGTDINNATQGKQKDQDTHNHEGCRKTVPKAVGWSISIIWFCGPTIIQWLADFRHI